MPERETEERGAIDYVPIMLFTWVAVVLILAAMTFGLEREDSPNTLAVVTLFGTVFIGPVLAVIALSLKARGEAAEMKQGVKEIQHALNGEFQPRVGDAVESIVGPRFDAIDYRLRQISERLHTGDEQFDAIRTQIAANTARLETLANCDRQAPETTP